MALLRFARRKGVSYITRRNQARLEDRVSVMRCQCAANNRLLCGADHISSRVTIAALPDNVLLDIFELHRMDRIRQGSGGWAKAWQRLVHVCRKWRYVVFGSPLRLRLYLYCTDTTPARKTLDVWPPLPIEISSSLGEDNEDNIIAVLEQHDRVFKISLSLTSLRRGRFDTTMQESFPALQDLQLWSEDSVQPLPDKFLGGSAPRLHYLYLVRIPFLGLPKLLLSCNDLAELYLYKIPNTGYVSPEAMATGLSALTRLKTLAIDFESPDSRPDRRVRLPPPLTRAILPSLTYFHFQGVSEYFEDLVARIDTPLVGAIDITFFNQLVFDFQQLPQFIHQAGMRGSYDRVSLFNRRGVHIHFYQREGMSPPKRLILGIIRGVTDWGWQISPMAQICDQTSMPLSSVEQFDIIDDHLTSPLNTGATQWAELLHLFSAVRTLRISAKLRSLIVSVLEKHNSELAAWVFPVLESVYIEGYEGSGSDQKAMRQFITARECADHPVTVHRWDRSESGWDDQCWNDR
jgi:hypothetical protein